jgi:polyphosphate glucokinase
MTENISRVLAIDIGGSHIKGSVLNMNGTIEADYTKLPTPQPATPQNVLQTIVELVKNFPEYDRVSVGFPGYVNEGIVYTAPNLAPGAWQKTEFARMISEKLGKPAKVINDADMQGLGVVSGVGLEMMVTLGTGFGTAFLKDGILLPHLELAHHPITKSKTYDQYIGEKAMLIVGVEKWNLRIKKVIEILKTVFNYDRLYLGGGNAKKINFPLDENVKVVTNKDAIDGGIKLWRQDA